MKLFDFVVFIALHVICVGLFPLSISYFGLVSLDCGFAASPFSFLFFLFICDGPIWLVLSFSLIGILGSLLSISFVLGTVHCSVAGLFSYIKLFFTFPSFPYICLLSCEFVKQNCLAICLTWFKFERDCDSSFGRI